MMIVRDDDIILGWDNTCKQCRRPLTTEEVTYRKYYMVKYAPLRELTTEELERFNKLGIGRLPGLKSALHDPASNNGHSGESLVTLMCEDCGEQNLKNFCHLHSFHL